MPHFESADRTRASKPASRVRQALLLTAFALGAVTAAAAWAGNKATPGSETSPALPRHFVSTPALAAFVSKMADTHGFDPRQLEGQLRQLRPNAKVLRLIRPPDSPRQRSWQRYQARFLTPTRIQAGTAFMQQHAAALVRAEARHGVPAAIIAAIIGVETEYGRNTGGFAVMEALATLAFYYPPRSAFFTDELEQFLLLARENHLVPSRIKGSFAGAIGIPQFMPGSLRRHAVDFDGDGQIDLSGSATDAIGSVAHFLAQHGWEAQGPISAVAQVDGDVSELLRHDILPYYPLAAWQGAHAPGDPQRKAALIVLETPDQPNSYRAGFHNFWVLTRYNRSSFYAMAVTELAQALSADWHAAEK